MKRVVQALTAFIRASPLAVYDAKTHAGSTHRYILCAALVLCVCVREMGCGFMDINALAGCGRRVAHGYYSVQSALRTDVPHAVRESTKRRPSPLVFRGGSSGAEHTEHTDTGRGLQRGRAVLAAAREQQARRHCQPMRLR